MIDAAHRKGRNVLARDPTDFVPARPVNSRLGVGRVKARGRTQPDLGNERRLQDGKGQTALDQVALGGPLGSLQREILRNGGKRNEDEAPDAGGSSGVFQVELALEVNCCDGVTRAP